MHGAVGVWGGFGGTWLTLLLLSPRRLPAPGQSISPAPGGHRRVQSGVTRIVLLIAGAVKPLISAEEDQPPCTPHKRARQGRLALLCKLCAGQAVPACPPPGAVLMVPHPLTQGLGLPCPGLVAPPEMEALIPPLCFWSCWQGRLGALPAPPCGVTACSPSPPSGTPHLGHELGCLSRVP